MLIFCTELPVCFIFSGFNFSKPLDPFHFTHLGIVFSNRPTLQLIASKYGEDCAEEALKGYGLVSCFLSALAQAHVRGRNTIQVFTFLKQIWSTLGTRFKFNFSSH